MPVVSLGFQVSMLLRETAAVVVVLVLVAVVVVVLEGVLGVDVLGVVGI
jgi:hypothetical protein